LCLPIRITLWIPFDPLETKTQHTSSQRFALVSIYTYNMSNDIPRRHWLIFFIKAHNFSILVGYDKQHDSFVATIISLDTTTFLFLIKYTIMHNLPIINVQYVYLQQSDVWRLCHIITSSCIIFLIPSIL
jgi:hypothetical protein